MCKIYVVEEHDQVLDLWRDQKVHSLRVLHLDAHCDMRGLLIDRQSKRAYRIWDKNHNVDPGNFLTHAILEGRISSIRWVYNDLGGRENDVGTVKYESDLTSQPYRWYLALRGERGLPINYEVISYTDWAGIAKNESLDIDWDFFAHTGYPYYAIQRNYETFLCSEFLEIPNEVYICYSPNFSHPSRIQFQSFVSELGRLFQAEVIYVENRSNFPVKSAIYKKIIPPSHMRLIRQLYYQLNLRLRKRGIF